MWEKYYKRKKRSGKRLKRLVDDFNAFYDSYYAKNYILGSLKITFSEVHNEFNVYIYSDEYFYDL